MQNHKTILQLFTRQLMMCAVVLIVCGHFSGNIHAADANKRSKLASRYTKERPLVILTDYDFAPYEFRDDNGHPAGYKIDVITTILDEMKVEYEFHMQNWTEAYANFKRRNGDLIINSKIFQIPHTYVGKSVITKYKTGAAYKKGEKPLINFDNANNDEIGFKENDFPHKYLTADSIFQPKIFAMPRQGLNMLLTNKLKYYVFNEQAMQTQFHEMADSILISDVDIPDAEVCFIGYDRELINELDSRFYDFERKGEIDRLKSKWFQQTPYTHHDKRIYLYILSAVLTALLLFAIYYFTRKRVNKIRKKTDKMNNVLWQALHINNNYIICNDLRTGTISNLNGNFLEDSPITVDKFIEMCHPDDVDTLLGRREMIINSKLYNCHEYRFKTHDKNEWRTYFVNSILEYDKKNRPSKIISTLTDVTEENRIEQNMLELSNKYEQMFNIPFMGISVYSTSGYLLQSNKCMQEIFKFQNEHDEYYFSSCLFDVEPVSGNIDPNNLEELIVCHKFNIHERGVYDFIEFHLCPVYNHEGEIIYIIIMARPLNEERKWERESIKNQNIINKRNEESQRYGQDLKAILGTIKIKIWKTFNKEQQFKIYNESDMEKTLPFSKMLDATKSEKDRDALLRIANITEDAPIEYTTIVVQMKKDIINDIDKDVWYMITYIPNVDNTGKIDGCFGLAHNITDEMQHQQYLMNETKIAQEIGQRKQEFLANMTHEIRTPLNAILGFSDLVNVTDSQEERKEYIKIINHNSKLLMKLTDNLLEVSRTDTETYEPTKQTEIDFAEFFNVTCNRIKPDSISQAIEYSIENPYTSLKIKTDPERIANILTNFVDNAAKYTSEGYIKVGYRIENEGIYIYCKDTGIGIPKDKQALIFERFFKVNDFIQGMGIGLYICKLIAEQMHGKIGLISEGEDKGTQFWVWIPLTK